MAGAAREALERHGHTTTTTAMATTTSLARPNDNTDNDDDDDHHHHHHTTATKPQPRSAVCLPMRPRVSFIARVPRITLPVACLYSCSVLVLLLLSPASPTGLLLVPLVQFKRPASYTVCGGARWWPCLCALLHASVLCATRTYRCTSARRAPSMAHGNANVSFLTDSPGPLFLTLTAIQLSTGTNRLLRCPGPCLVCVCGTLYNAALGIAPVMRRSSC